MLFATLCNSGARINEALTLGRIDFLLQPPYPSVQLATLKQREEKAVRTAWSHCPISIICHSFR